MKENRIDGAEQSEAEYTECEEKECGMSADSIKCGCCRKKKRTRQEYKNLVNRLNRIEGQIRGIKNMLDNDAYCIDILVQVSAASSALSSFSKVLLTEHIKTCVAEDLRNGKDETVDELTDVLRRLLK